MFFTRIFMRTVFFFFKFLEGRAALNRIITVLKLEFREHLDLTQLTCLSFLRQARYVIRVNKKNITLYKICTFNFYFKGYLR